MPNTTTTVPPSPTRRKNMQAIHSRDTSIELTLRKALWHRGIRYRKNYKALPGKPDIAITRYKIAVFCDSEFFHGRNWASSLKAQVLRGNNAEFWSGKIERNMARAMETAPRLTTMGWTVIHFWGEEINRHLDDCIRVVEEAIEEAKHPVREDPAEFPEDPEEPQAPDTQKE